MSSKFEIEASFKTENSTYTIDTTIQTLQTLAAQQYSAGQENPRLKK